MDLLPYERVDSKALLDAIRVYPGEHLLVLQPFGWHMDGKHIPNMPEQFSREYVCDLFNFVVVSDFGGYIAIVRERPAREEQP